MVEPEVAFMEFDELMAWKDQFFFRLDVSQNLCHARDRTEDGVLRLVSDLMSATHG